MWLPQSSIFGPLLFLLYINNIVFVSDVGNMIMFADDTNLFFSGLDFNCMCAFINQELIKIRNWFKANKIRKLITYCFIAETTKGNLTHH